MNDLFAICSTTVQRMRDFITKMQVSFQLFDRQTKPHFYPTSCLSEAKNWLAGGTSGLACSNTIPSTNYTPLSVSPSVANNIDWLGASSEIIDESVQNCAWMFSDSALNDLYTIPFMDSTVPYNPI